MSGLTTYSDEQAQARLRETLTGWSVEGGHLRRHFATDGWRASMLMANGIGDALEDEAGRDRRALHVGQAGQEPRRLRASSRHGARRGVVRLSLLHRSRWRDGACRGPRGATPRCGCACLCRLMLL